LPAFACLSVGGTLRMNLRDVFETSIVPWSRNDQLSVKNNLHPGIYLRYF